ncbi:MAG: cell wall hydrolase, partial [Brevundimonas sp.]|nr:cell wall hydrolase [Brevundimonas sp.]
VVIDGQTRVVGVVSLGGRQQPTREQIADINQRLAAFETPVREAPAPSPPPPGVTVMDVEEVGRPAS